MMEHPLVGADADESGPVGGPPVRVEPAVEADGMEEDRQRA
jgi:hypothetical protein